MGKKIKIEDLKKKLTDAGIDISKYGVGKAKTLKHLKKEIESGESILITEKNGKLLRRVYVATADIYYNANNGKKYRLKEDRQVFRDGRERKRNLLHSISEKIKPNENPIDGIIRGIKEELGIVGEINVYEKGKDIERATSQSYPGLETEYVFYKFEAILSDEQFNPEGYIERQPDKTTYFVWEEAE